MSTQAKVIISAEDRTSAAFGSVLRNVDKLGFNFDTLKAGAIGALSALAVPVSVAGIASVFNESRKAIDGLKDLADASGASLGNLSALDNIARSTGGSLETVSSILVKFNGVLADADPTKGVGATLKAIGLSVEELKRLDPAEALRLTAVEIEKLGSETDKARVYQELFGKATRDAAPFLKDLAEAKRLDATLTEEQVEQVDRFNKEMAKLQATAGNAARSLSITVAGALNTVIDRFKEGQKEGKNFWQIALEGYKKDVAGIYGVGGGATVAPGRMSSGGIVDPTDPRAVLRRIEREQDTRPNASVLPPAAPTRTPRASTPRAAPAPAAAPDRLGEFIRGDDVQAGIARTDDMARAAARAIEQTRTPLERLGAKESELGTLLAKNYIDQETYLRARAEAQSEYAQTIDWTVKKVEESSSQAEKMAEKLGDAFTNTLDDAFKSGMKFGDLLKKLAFDALNVRVLTPAVQGAGSALGTAAASLFAGYFADGGYIPPGQWGMTGERGPEPVFGGRTGVTVQPNGAGSGGGGLSISQVFNFQAAADSSTVAQLKAVASQIKAETLAAVQSNANRGGSFASSVGRA